LFSRRRRSGMPLLALSGRALQPRGRAAALVHPRALRMSAYAELAITTNFSFLHGASRPQEIAEQATLLGLSAIGIADRNSLAGVVRVWDALRQIQGEKPRLLVGSRLVFADGTPDILAYPKDRRAYGNLCRLISEGKLRAKKGDCALFFDDLARWQEGLL